MDLLEIMGESMSPGAIGTINMGARPKHYKSRSLVIVKIVLATGFLVGILYWYLHLSANWQESTHIKFGIGFTIYLLLGYYIHPEPDTSNLGWLGGLLDNPFRYSDDINWLLIWLKVFLFPAKFLSYSLVDFVRLVLSDASLIKPHQMSEEVQKIFEKKKLPTSTSVYQPSSTSTDNDYLSVTCPNGHNFIVDKLYSGAFRRCSICNEKTQVP